MQTKGTLYLGPIGYGVWEDGGTRDMLFCNQARNCKCKAVASIAIELFVSLSKVAFLSTF